MKLSQTINVLPPPFSDNSGNVTRPEAIVADTLNVAFNIDVKGKYISAQIEQFPNPLYLYTGQAFEDLNGFWNQELLERRVLQLLGDNPSTT